ncbi:MAG: hypothetical protein PF436_13300 [Prolixibacteraceae bacterium]|jgi:hypothetical protein|nr:hypothetical protein [Prolixibacteraceae bacterium]
MTLTKHIILLVLLLPAFGLVAQAQSSALNPYEGATHTYAWNGLAEGLNYSLYITDNADGSGLLEDATTMEFDFLGDTDGIVGTDNKAGTNIAWNNGAAMNTYYLWVQATGSSGCSNYRYVEITPQYPDFDLMAENVPVDNTISCPATDSQDGFMAEADLYSAGATKLEFRVARQNGTENPMASGATYSWSFIPQLEVAPDLGLDNVIITVEGTNSGVITADGANRYTVNGDDDEVIVTVSIQNAPGYDLALSLLLTGQEESNTNLTDNNSNNDKATHTIQIMPLIEGMGGV